MSALPTLLLTQREVERLVDLRKAIRVVREAFTALARGETVMPPKVYLPLPRRSDFRAMPAFLQHPPACGIKWVNVHPDNRRRGLPTVMALIIMSDPATGEPLAVMDGVVITTLRTAAASAVAAQALARPESHTVGLVGCGAQAGMQVLALAEVFALSRVTAWSKAPGEAGRFCHRMQRRLPRVRWSAAANVASCVREADLIVTVTPSRRPLIRRSWVRPGTHINAVGADAPGKQELDPRILQEARVVVDDAAQAIHGGEVNVPIRRKQFRPSQIHATLGEILIGRRHGRRSDAEITVFDSTGLAIHDVALGAHVLWAARRHRRGRRLAFFTPS